MPRRHRPVRRAPAPAAPPRAVVSRAEEFRGETYQVRSVAGERGRSYRCPGCDQLVAGGAPHVVAWSADRDGDDRRHWHTACWAERERRSVTRRWS